MNRREPVTEDELVVAEMLPELWAEILRMEARAQDLRNMRLRETCFREKARLSGKESVFRNCAREVIAAAARDFA